MNEKLMKSQPRINDKLLKSQPRINDKLSNHSPGLMKSQERNSPGKLNDTSSLNLWVLYTMAHRAVPVFIDKNGSYPSKGRQQ